MKYVVIDLEMNPVSKGSDARKISREEVIEIGAVLLDEGYNEIGNFKTFVKPQYNTRIEKKIEKLTKITTEMVEDGPDFIQAWKSFIAWLTEISDQVQIYQWSENDLCQIVREMQLKQYQPTAEEEKYLTEWLDFQKECGEKLNLERQISLSQAITYAGMEFEGYAHDALFDARNTAKLLQIIRDPGLCKEALGRVMVALEEKSLGVTLGDLFNFSLFAVAT